MVLFGKYVKLSPMQLEDVEKMISWERHEDILFADYNFPPWSAKERKKWFLSKTSGTKQCFSIFDREGVLIGYISLRKVNLLLKTGEIGILLRPSAIGKKYGRDALRTFLKWATESEKFRKLKLTVARYNDRAIACYQSVGFVLKRKFFDYCYNDQIVPFEIEGWEKIAPYFKYSGSHLFVQYYEMQIHRDNIRYGA